MKKSAEARSHASGMFQTTAIRSSALTSGSWGYAVSGCQKKVRRSMSPSTIWARSACRHRAVRCAASSPGSRPRSPATLAQPPPEGHPRTVGGLPRQVAARYARMQNEQYHPVHSLPVVQPLAAGVAEPSGLGQDKRLDPLPQPAIGGDRPG